MGARNRTHTAPRRTDTTDPSWSRERALRILFQADLRGVQPSVTLTRVDADPAARSLLDEHDCLADEEPILPSEAASHAAPDTASSKADPSADTARAGRRETGEPTADQAADQAAHTPRTGRPDTGGPADDQAGDPVGDPVGDAAPRPSASGWSDTPGTEVAAIDGFTRGLVLGVERERPQVEALISRYARRWAISRMPVVDRNVLRLATYELLYEPTPPAVVLNEAIGLAKRLSTEDSGRFVNGVLESIRQEIVRTRAEVSPDTDEVG